MLKKLKMVMNPCHRKLNYWNCYWKYWYESGDFFEIDTSYPCSFSYANPLEKFYVICDSSKKNHGLLKLNHKEYQILLDPYYRLMNLKNMAYAFINDETDTIHIFFKPEYLVLGSENNIAVLNDCNSIVDYREIPNVSSNFFIVIKDKISKMEKLIVALEYNQIQKLIESEHISLANLNKREILTSEKLYDVSIERDIVILQEKKLF